MIPDAARGSQETKADVPLLPIAQGTMPNARMVTVVTAQDQNETLLAAIVGKINNAIISKAALDFLKRKGYLKIDIVFKDGSVDKNEGEMKCRITSLDDLGLISGDISLNLEKKIHEIIHPKLSRVKLNPKFNLESMQLDISECRQRMHMVSTGEYQGIPYSGYHIHFGINEVQKSLHEAEMDYQRSLANEVKVEAVIKHIFYSNDPQTPFNQIAAAIKIGDLKSFKNFRIAFNCTDPELKGLFKKSEEKFLVKATLNFAAIALFFQKVQKFLGPPKCKFLSFEPLADNKILCRDQADGECIEPIRVIAKYTKMAIVRMFLVPDV